MKRLIILLAVVLMANFLYAQNNSCTTSEPFCTGVTYGFPMGTNTTAEVGPNYGCLYTQPNPYWYYLLIDEPGDLSIYMESPTGNDIDFVAWGPFPYPNTVCNGGLTAGCTSCPNNTGDPNFYPSGLMVDCSYDPAPVETFHISNALHGQYYTLCITNYSNAPGDIVFSQTNAGMPGAGTTTCSILTFCHFVDDSLTVTNCDSVSNSHSVNGLISVVNQPTTGELIIYDDFGNSTTLYPPFDSTLSFSLNGLPSNGYNSFLHAYFTDDSLCNGVFPFTAPNPCVDCFAFAGHDKTVCSLTSNLEGITYPGYAGGHWSGFPASAHLDDINDPHTGFSVDTAGYYSFVWSHEGSNGHICSDTVVYYMTDFPVASWVVHSAPCPNDSAFIEFNGNAGPYAVIDFWCAIGNFQQIPGTNDFLYLSPVAGTQAISAQISDHGCESNLYSGVVQTVAQTTISTTTSICASSGQIWGIHTSGPNPPFTYTWSNITGPPFAPGMYSVTVTDAQGCTFTRVFSADTSSTQYYTNYSNLNCYGNHSGTASITVTGNHSPYTYLWSNGATTSSVLNLNASNYTVTVTDHHGCTFTRVFSLTQPGQMNPVTTTQAILCTGQCNGSLTVNSVANAHLPVTYLWSTGSTANSISNLCAGSYFVTITDNAGCTISKPYTMANPAGVSIVSTNIQEDCSAACNGLISVTVNNNPTPITYAWGGGQTGNTIQNLCAGTYSVTATNGSGCTNTAIFNVPATINSLAMTVLNYDSMSCPVNCDGSVAVNVTGGTSPYIYSWGFSGSPSVVLCPGNHTITVTDQNNCTIQQSFQIYPSDTTYVFAGNDTAICSGEDVTLYGLSSNPMAHWFSSVQNGVPFIPAATEVYYFGVNDTTSCLIYDSVIVSVLPVSAMTAGPDKSVCEGNMVSLTATGGDTYEWSGGIYQGIPFVPTSTQAYYVTITNSFGCSKVDTAMVYVLNYPTANGGPDVVICPGEPVVLYGTGGDYHVWMGGIYSGTPFYPVNTTSYILTSCFYNGCCDVDTVLVTLVPNPPTPVISVSNDTLFSSAISGNQWFFNGVPISGANNDYFVPNVSGYYSVAYSDTCSSDTSLSIHVIITVTGLVQEDFNVWPNPANSELNIAWSGTKGTLELFDLKGRIVFRQQVQDREFTVHVNDFSPGLYHLIISNDLQMFKATIEIQE